MKIYLLSHPRELKKPTNTGRIVKECLPTAVEIIPWRRTEPPEEIIELIDGNDIALLFPATGDDAAGSWSDFNNFIILDATWQEARKMYNRSPYLQRAGRISLGITEPSRYQLRRNQIEHGLSTAECAIELLRRKDHPGWAEKVSRSFDLLNDKNKQGY